MTRIVTIDWYIGKVLALTQDRRVLLALKRPGRLGFEGAEALFRKRLSLNANVVFEHDGDVPNIPKGPKIRLAGRH